MCLRLCRRQNERNKKVVAKKVTLDFKLEIMMHRTNRVDATNALQRTTSLSKPTTETTISKREYPRPRSWTLRAHLLRHLWIGMRRLGKIQLHASSHSCSRNYIWLRSRMQFDPSHHIKTEKLAWNQNHQLLRRNDKSMRGKFYLFHITMAQCTVTPVTPTPSASSFCSHSILTSARIAIRRLIARHRRRRRWRFKWSYH